MLVDDDGDEFPIALPGIYRENRGADIEAALQIAGEAVAAGSFRPRGGFKCDRIEYVGESA
jgi:hypothetical protein